MRAGQQGATYDQDFVVVFNRGGAAAPQAVGDPSDPFLDKVTVCSGGPATWSMSPGRPNDMPLSLPPDLGAPPPPDLAGTAHDLGVDPFADLGADLASGEDDSGVVLGAADMTRFGGASRGGCAMGGSGETGGGFVLLMMGGLLARRERRGRRCHRSTP